MRLTGYGRRRGSKKLGSTCPGGEIGRRKGLKILFPATGVWVQVPPRAPKFFERNRCPDTMLDRNRRSHQSSDSLHASVRCVQSVANMETVTQGLSDIGPLESARTVA